MCVHAYVHVCVHAFTRDMDMHQYTYQYRIFVYTCSQYTDIRIYKQFQHIHIGTINRFCITQNVYMPT